MTTQNNQRAGNGASVPPTTLYQSADIVPLHPEAHGWSGLAPTQRNSEDGTEKEVEMSDVSREELDTKLENVKLKSEKEIQAIEKNVEFLLKGFDEFKQDTKSQIATLGTKIDSQITETMKNRKYTIWTILSTGLVVGGLIYAAYSLGVGMFDAIINYENTHQQSETDDQS